MPSGTDTYNSRYLALTGSTSNYASTASSGANTITGDIDLRTKAAIANWATPATEQRFVCKGNDYCLGLTTAGNVYFYNYDGSSFHYIFSSVSLNSTQAPAGSTRWIRATYQPNITGSYQTNFYFSSDGTSWTQVGTAQSGPAFVPISNTFPVTVGVSYTGTNPVTGKIYFASVVAAISGTTTSSSTCAGAAACFNPGDATQSQAASGSWPSSSPQTETWSLNRSGSNLPADIAADLTVSSVTGLPAGGSASYRLVDGVAAYILPTPTSITSGTPCSLGLTGFTNTSVSGSYASSIVTYDNSPTPILVDSTTTAALAFAAATGSAIDSVTIDPTFTFVVANQPAACNGESNFVSGAGTAAAVALGHLASAANVSGGQLLSVVTNAGSGFAVYVRGPQSTQNLRSTTHNWTDVSGTYATPALWVAARLLATHIRIRRHQQP